MERAESTMDVPEASEQVSGVLERVGEAVIAERRFFEDVLLGVLARGHVLLEDVPGTGKTLTARTLADALGLSFSRIQFTPDLLPSDVTGTHVFNEGTREFEFNEGPIFANVVLADEINRAPPKTQAALLEAMEERQVTTDGDTRALPEPFIVIATQNPVEQEGSLHPEETLVMDGQLWEAGEALAYAKATGDLVHDGDTRVYDAGTTTQTLTAAGELVERACLVYETAYEGQLVTVETETGRRIRVSGNHPFLVTRAGAVQWVEARDLDEEDALVTPDTLDVAERPLPSHDEALESLRADWPDWQVVRQETVAAAAATLDAGADLSREDLEALRVAAGLSQEAFAARVDTPDDRVRDYLAGAATDVGADLAAAVSEASIAVADHVEADAIHTFEAELTAAEAGFFVGHVLAAGAVTDASVRISEATDPDRFDRWVELATRLGFAPRVRETDGGRQAAIESPPLVAYLDTRYGLRTPGQVLTAPAPFRRSLLDVVMRAAGTVDADRPRLTVALPDRETTNVVAHLLLQFGVRPRIETEGADEKEDENEDEDEDGAEAEDGGYRITVQGEAVRAYCEAFTWPGDAPEVAAVDSACRHPATPGDAAGRATSSDRRGSDHDGLSVWAGVTSSGTAPEARDRLAAADRRAAPVAVASARATRQGDTPAAPRANREAAAGASGVALPARVAAAARATQAGRQAARGQRTPEAPLEAVAADAAAGVAAADRQTGRARRRNQAAGDVFHDRIRTIDREPYDGQVIGLSVPGTHNYLAGLGACGINHNTFPLPEAQVDRFMVKTSIGYPDEAGEVELLRRRAGRTTQSPSIEAIFSKQEVQDLQSVPEGIRVDDDLLDYMATIARATRQDRRVEVGVSPRGTQRLFETARARAVIEGREYVTPDDVKAIAQPVLAHRIVLTPDATVNNVSKREVVADVLDEVPVPTVE